MLLGIWLKYLKILYMKYLCEFWTLCIILKRYTISFGEYNIYFNVQ